MKGSNLAQRWKDTITAGEEALTASNWLSLLDSIVTAYPLVSELDALNPLSQLDQEGKESAIEIANHQCKFDHTL